MNGEVREVEAIFKLFSDYRTRINEEAGMIHRAVVARKTHNI